MAPRVFTIPPGAPFLESFSRALLDGRVVPGLSRDSGPLALAKAKIYVPTRRAGRALATELARQSDSPAVLLPQILPLGALDGESGRGSAAGFDNPLDPRFSARGGRHRAADDSGRTDPRLGALPQTGDRLDRCRRRDPPFARNPARRGPSRRRLAAVGRPRRADRRDDHRECRLERPSRRSAANSTIIGGSR